MSIYRQGVAVNASTTVAESIGAVLTGIHYHECESCGHVWSHSADMFNNAEAHTCSVCGDGPWWFGSSSRPIARRTP